MSLTILPDAVGTPGAAPKRDEFAVATATAGAAGAISTRHRFDEELTGLEARLCAMSRAAAGMLEDACRALFTGDEGLAWSVVERDAEIDELDRDVEASALLLVARQQPVASDLRQLGAALKMTTDIERIGDHAVNVARVAVRLQGAGLRYRPEVVDLPRIAQMAVCMVRDAADALEARDVAAARVVIRRDDELDVLYKEAQRELRSAMQHSGGDADLTVLSSHLLFVAHYLERVGDHCTSIAERLEYQETGRAPLPRAAAVAAAAAAAAASAGWDDEEGEDA